MPTILNDYRYDPLDRLVGTRDVLRFYNAKYIATEVEGDVTRFFLHTRRNRWPSCNSKRA